LANLRQIICRLTEAAFVNGTRNIYGAFSQGNLQITSWLAVNAGLQYTHGKLQSNAPPFCFGRTCYDTPSPNRQRALDPSFGLTLEPHRTVQLFAQWSHGSRMPTVRESLMQINFGVFPNPDLKMEKAKNFEYGVNLLFDSLLSVGDSLGIKFSKFDNKYNDYIVRNDSRLMRESNQRYYKFDNIDARYQGYELAVDYDNDWLFGNFSLVYFDKVQYCFVNSERHPSYSPIVLLPKACYNQPPITDYLGSYIPPKQEKNAGLGVRLFDQKLVLGQP